MRTTDLEVDNGSEHEKKQTDLRRQDGQNSIIAVYYILSLFIYTSCALYMWRRGSKFLHIKD